MRINMIRRWNPAVARRDDVWRQKCVDGWRNKGLQEVKQVAPKSQPFWIYPYSDWVIEKTLDQAFG